jgi:WD40 repeat protein
MLAAVSHKDGGVSLWNLRAAKLEDTLLYHNADCRTVEFSSDGHWLLSSSFDYTIGVLEMATKQVTKLKFHNDRVVNAKWHTQLPIILSTSADKTARVIGPQHFSNL